jgi:uncharacterized protein YbbC (DUF1343 family)
MLSVLFWCTVSCADREHSASTAVFQSNNDKAGAQHSIETQDLEPVETGAVRLLQNDELLSSIENKRVGLLSNPTGRVGNAHLVDTLLARNVNLTALFAPEHGFRGEAGAGEEIRDGVDVESGLPVFSLYGSSRKPSPEMLDEVDVIIFDMQDVGARFYTYISTLGLLLEAVAEHPDAIEVIVLDRPNPLGGSYVSGWLAEPEHQSFVGAFPIPVVHGMTIGELAGMMLGEGWIPQAENVNLRVIEMQHWRREMIWPDTGLPWLAPSPNLPHYSTALMYPGTCFFEGSTLSEGRGTPDPFLQVGGPSLQLNDEAISALESRYAVQLDTLSFTPVSIPGVAAYPKHEGQLVRGVRISPLTLRPDELRPLEFGLELLRLMLQNAPEAETKAFLYNLAGTQKIDAFLSSDQHPGRSWQNDVETFREQRAPYLLY